MADQEYGSCDSCGKPLHGDDDFTWRADAINAALDDADWLTSETLLAMFVGRHLSRFPAEERQKAKRSLLREIGKETKTWVIDGCDA